jgi:hypothetical protein
MVDLLRRYVAFLALGLLGWLVYSALNPDNSDKKAEAKVERLEIDPKLMIVRPTDDPAAAIADPFRMVAPSAKAKSGPQPSGGGSAAALAAAGPSGPADPLDVAGAWVASLRVLGHDLVGAAGWWGQPASAASSGSAANGAKTSAAAHVPHPFEMVLQSTLAVPDGGQARISGRTANVGDALDWLDADDPPHLAAVEGTSATVVRGADTWVLDLLTNPSITVGGALALATSEGAARVAAKAGMGGARPPRALPSKPGGMGAAPAAASAAAAPPAAAPAAGGTSHGYRVRTYPGKPK